VKGFWSLLRNGSAWQFAADITENTAKKIVGNKKAPMALGPMGLFLNNV